MTTTEFKQKYPQYKDLEGDELWNKITESLLESDNTLYADPNQEVIYKEPITLNVVLDNGLTSKSIFKVADETKTKWLNKDEKLVRVGTIEKVPRKDNTTYRGVICDVNNSSL